MGLRKGQNNGNHGKKGASGRKPSAFTLLKRRIESEKSDDAEYAFALYSQVMRDDTQPMELRLNCGDWIANRVLGKPKDRTEQSGELVIRIVRSDSNSPKSA